MNVIKNKTRNYSYSELTDNSNLYKEMLITIRKLRKEETSWGDIYYKICWMIHDALYDVELEEMY